MSIFGKKSDEEHPRSAEVGGGPTGTDSRSYGIADVIRVLRTLPVDQHTELVLRVVKKTLESVNVQIPDLVADAVKQEEKLGGRIATLQTKIQELSKQMEVQRQEVSRLEAELAETTSAKQRLQLAEKSAASVPAAKVGSPPPGQGHPQVPPGR
jgi:hypothetical protein